jgi:hypothetical protein
MRTLSNTYKVTTMIEITGCTEQAAIDYLIAEEWDITDALMSYRADQKGTGQTS